MTTFKLSEMQDAVREFKARVLPPGITFHDQFGKLLEEVAETLQAYNKGDTRGVYDGLGDTFYVLLGLCNLAGADLEDLFNAIHASNMTKTRDGTLSPKGKEFKPPELRVKHEGEA